MREKLEKGKKGSKGKIKRAGILPAIISAAAISFGGQTVNAREPIRTEVSCENHLSKFEAGVEPEIVNFYNYGMSNFYKDFTIEKRTYVEGFYKNAIKKSNSVDEFFKRLSEEQLTQKEKLLLLQVLGNNLQKNYDYELLESGDHVKISPESMFQRLKNGEHTGISGNIHVFLTDAANRLGMEAWFQHVFISPDSTAGDQGGHGTMFVIAKDENDKEQIVFIDFDDLIFTRTLDLEKALGLLEMRNHALNLPGYTSNTKEDLVQKRTPAQRIIAKAANIEETTGILSKNLERGNMTVPYDRLTIQACEEKEITLEKSNGITISAFLYKNPGDFYNSLHDLKALRIEKNFAGKKSNLELNLTAINMSLKDLLSDNVYPREALVGKLVANYIDSINLTKEKYKRYILNLGSTLQGVASMLLPFDLKNAYAQGNKIIAYADLGFGSRLIYIDPTRPGTFFIEAENVLKTRSGSPESPIYGLRKFLYNFTVGGEYKVNEFTVKGETGLENTISSEKDIIRLELRHNIGSINLDLSKKFPKSSFERLEPEKTETKLEFTSNYFPIGELRFFVLDTSTKVKEESGEREEIKGGISVVYLFP